MYKEKDLPYVCNGDCMYCLPALVDKGHVCYSKENENIIKRILPGKNPALVIIGQFSPPNLPIKHEPEMLSMA